MSRKEVAKLEAVVAELEDWSAQHHLVEEAVASAKVSLRNCEQDEAELGLVPVLDYNQILLDFDKQSLVFKSGLLDYAYLDTRIGLYLQDEGCFRGLKQIGYYRLITRLDGQIEDDYLIFDEPYKVQSTDAA